MAKEPSFMNDPTFFKMTMDTTYGNVQTMLMKANDYINKVNQSDGNIRQILNALKIQFNINQTLNQRIGIITEELLKGQTTHNPLIGQDGGKRKSRRHKKSHHRKRRHTRRA